MIELVIEIVDTSPRPVPLATVGQVVRGKLGEEPRLSDWGGTGSLTNLLTSEAHRKFCLSNVGTGYVYDPLRHQPPIGTKGGVACTGSTALQDFLRRLHRVAGIPLLESATYVALFRVIRDEVTANGFILNSTSKAVRDECKRLGSPVSRSDVSFVLIGLTHSGLAFQNPVNLSCATDLAEAFLKSVFLRCEDVQLELSSSEQNYLRGWILGDSPTFLNQGRVVAAS